MDTKANMDLVPQGPSGDGPYYLYTRRKHGLWTSLNMMIFYIILIAVALWGREYILLGMMVLLAIWLIYDQITNPQFVEVNSNYLRYRLPKKVEAEIALDAVTSIELSPDQVRLELSDGDPVVLEINALLSRSKRAELREYLKNNIEEIQEVDK